MLNIKTFSNILVVVAHPDDEWWGIGGTLLRLKEEFKCYISIVMVSDGERGDGTGEERMKLSKELANANGISFDTIGIPANSLQYHKPEIIAYLDKLAIPPFVFSHFEGDTHFDHKAVNECVLASLRGRNNISYLQMETAFQYGFMPNFYVNISKHFHQKMQLYEKYFADEMKRRKEYLPKNIAVINLFRGLEFGVDYAEAFILLRGGFK